MTDIAFFTLRSLDVHRTDRRHGFIGGSPTQVPIFVHSRRVIATSRTRIAGITFGTFRTHFAGFTLGTTDVGDVNRIDCRHTLLGCFPRDHTFCGDSRCIVPANRAVRTGRTLGTNVTLGAPDVDGFHSGHGLIGSCPGQITSFIHSRRVVPTIGTLRSFGTSRTILEDTVFNGRHGFIGRSPGDVTVGRCGRGVITTRDTIGTGRTFDIDRRHTLHRFIGGSPTEGSILCNGRGVVATVFARHTGCTRSTLRSTNVGPCNGRHVLVRGSPCQIARGIHRGSVIPAVIALRSLGTASRKRNGIDRRHISLARSKGYVTRFINGRNIISASFTLRTLRTDVARFTFVTLGTRFTLRTSRTGFTTRADIALGTTVTLQTFLCKDLIIFASHRSDAHDILQHQKAAAGMGDNVKFRVLRRGVVFASRSQ